jgi:hypothetical protein
MRKYVINSDRFIEGLVDCERATYNEKIFGSVHGYYGLDAKDPCEKMGGLFSFIVRHPLSRVHSAYIYYLYNFYYKKFDLGVENKNVHDRSCFILSENVDLMKYTDSYNLITKKVDPPKTKVDNRYLFMIRPVKKVIKIILPHVLLEYLIWLKTAITKANKNDSFMEKNIEISNAPSIPDEKDHLSRVFIKMCKTFLPYDSILYKECSLSGIKMEEMVKSSEYFKNHLMPLVAPQLEITDAYLESVFSGKMDLGNKWPKASNQRFNVHRDEPLSPQEIWISWPKQMRDVFRKYFDEFDCGSVCTAFDYDVSFI